MKTILHTFGVAQAWDLASNLHFTHVIAPATLARPGQDRETAAEAKARGMSVYFDLSQHNALLESTRFLDLLVAWADEMVGVHGCAGVWMSDRDKMDHPAHSVCLRMRERGLDVAASMRPIVSESAYTIAAESLSAIAFPVYKYWGGDGAEVDDATRLGTTAAQWARFQAAAPSPTRRWLMLQAFFDRKWGVTATNKMPQLSHMLDVWGDAIAQDAAIDAVVFFGLGAAAGTQRRYAGIGQEPSIRDAVGFFNGTRLGRPYVLPSWQMVRHGETRIIVCSTSGMTWALVSAPDGCEIIASSDGSTGTFRAGNESGEAVVSASKDGVYVTATLIVFKEP